MTSREFQTEGKVEASKTYCTAQKDKLLKTYNGPVKYSIDFFEGVEYWLRRYLVLLQASKRRQKRTDPKYSICREDSLKKREFGMLYEEVKSTFAKGKILRENLQEDSEMMCDTVVIRIKPRKMVYVYGLGISMNQLRKDPTSARYKVTIPSARLQKLGSPQKVLVEA